MLNDLLSRRELPELLAMEDGSPVTAGNWPKRRQELVDILSHWEYGKMPEVLGPTAFRVVEEETQECAAGTAVSRKVEITFPTPLLGSFTFPVTVSIPKSATAANPKPAFVYISFGWAKYTPLEELMNHDVIIAEMVMNDVALDKEDSYANLMAAHYFKDGQRPEDGFGKIGMWAFAASRVLDYLLTLEEVDPQHAGVIGHSRLGKTALWAGANDIRFTHVYSNDSGCSGAAITRKKVGETFPAIARVFPYWFCPNMQKVSVSVEASEQVPFDQHFLLAAMAPRKLYVASAELDEWADPESEFLAACAASPAWEINGQNGLISPDRLPDIWDTLQDGNVGYHLRAGTHFLSRHDWVRYIRFIQK